MTTYQQIPKVQSGIESVPEYPVILLIVPATFVKIVLKSIVIYYPTSASAYQAKNGLAGASATSEKSTATAF